MVQGAGGMGFVTPQPAAASGAWTADGTFTAKLCFYETPFTITVRLSFSGKELQYSSAGKRRLRLEPRNHNWWGRPSESFENLQNRTLPG